PAACSIWYAVGIKSDAIQRKLLLRSGEASRILRCRQPATLSSSPVAKERRSAYATEAQGPRLEARPSPPSAAVRARKARSLAVFRPPEDRLHALREERPPEPREGRGRGTVHYAALGPAHAG